MGITIISSAPSGSANGSSAPSGLLPTDTQSGQFAGLLSGQLQNLAGLLNGLTDGANASGTSKKGLKTEAGDDTATGLPDLALVAALNGQAQLSQTAGGGSNLADKGLSAAAKGGNAVGDQKLLEAALQQSEKSATSGSHTEAAGDFDKLLQAGNLSKGGGLPAATPANIAVDKNALSDLLPTASGAIGQQAVGQPPAAMAPAPAQTTIGAPLHDSAWSQQLGDKIVWMAKGDQQSAHININPPQLGPLQLTIHLNGDQVNAAFASPHAEVRHAIENALPQLREMLSSAGINLGQADVGANMARQNPQTPFQAPDGKRLGGETAILPANGNAANTGASPVLQRGRGLVDLFA